MEWEPEQQDLGGLGFAGIYRETYRVLLRAILPHTKGGLGAAILTALLVANPAAIRAFLTRGPIGDDNGSDLFRLVVFFILEVVYLCVVFLLSLVCTAAYVFRVASLYCTDGDSGATDRILRNLPREPYWRFYLTFTQVVPLATYIGLACLVLLQLDACDEVIVLPLRVLGGAACLAVAAYVSVVSRLACVVSILEDAVLFGAVRKSRALLAGKFWAAAAVFVPLDGCFLALQTSLLVMISEDAMDLWLQVVAGAAIAVALWAVVVVTLVAQPVVYMVCKNHHHEVVDKVHLNYVGEYQRLGVDADNGVELQPVNTAPQPTATASQAILPTTSTDS
uniref:Uncharacterized protein n=1 Tax=Avena sativa TaxID=4498 RepID=A0ACD5W3S4_AVESA